MKRRQYIAAAGTGALAGCQTFKNITRSGPPYFEEVSISGPSEVAVGERFEITDIGLDRTKSTTIGPLQIGYSGDISFKITDHNASHDGRQTKTRSFSSRENF
jgi:hypothetical protein